MHALVLVAAIGDGVPHRAARGIDAFHFVCPVTLVGAVGVGAVADLRSVDDNPAG